MKILIFVDVNRGNLERIVFFCVDGIFRYGFVIFFDLHHKHVEVDKFFFLHHEYQPDS